jgi:protein-S-isoprenylcysteine O-methyltransferase Ste14
VTTKTRGDFIWFTLQFVLCLAMIVVLAFRRRLPQSVPIVGVGLIVTGAAIGNAGYRTLGGSHSEWSTPALGARLVTTGIYRYVRHPIYLGWSLTAVGGALLARTIPRLAVAAALVAFYDLRARHEERPLAERYPGYGCYTSSSARFIPAVY